MLSYTDPAVSVADADSYAALRAWSDWTGAEEAKVAAIRRGQDYIAGVGNGRWATEWSNDDAPAEVKYAIIEAARRELSNPGSLSPDVVTGTIRKRARVEGAVEVEYAVPTGHIGADAMRPDIAVIDALLKALLATGGGSVDLLRI